MISLSFLAVIVYHWWCWKTMSLKFDTYQLIFQVGFEVIRKSRLWFLCLGIFLRALWLNATASSVFLLLQKYLDHLERNVVFFWFLVHGFRSSRLTENLLIVVADRITRAFIKSGTTRTVALDTSKSIDRVWHTGLLDRRRSNGVFNGVFGHISSFLSN